MNLEYEKEDKERKVFVERYKYRIKRRIREVYEKRYKRRCNKRQEQNTG
jgi:hypothetical protein